MSHDIEQYDGGASFVSARTAAWHRLGTVVDNSMTAAEALKLARLDWEVKKAPVFADFNGTKIEIEGRKAIYRDNPEGGDPIVFQVASNLWNPVQNVEAFSFLDELIEAKGGAHYETAGALKQGHRVFMTVKMPEDLTIDPNGAADKIETYLLVTNGHDGSMAFTVAVTPVRVVCQNTLTAGLNRAKRKWSTIHFGNVKGRVEQAKETIGLTSKYADEFAKLAEAMVQQTYRDSDFTKLTGKLFPTDAASTDRQKATADNARQALSFLFKEAATNENIRGTKWAAYQAVTEYADWVRPVRGDDASEKRARDTLFGEGVLNLKQTALDLLTV